MIFTIPKSGKTISFAGKLLEIKGGKFETTNKALQKTLSKCKGVNELKEVELKK